MTTVPPSSLNEGRDRSPGDTQRGGGRCLRGPVRSTKAGTVVPATRQGGRGGFGPCPTLNEGRDRSPGDT